MHRKERALSVSDTLSLREIVDRRRALVARGVTVIYTAPGHPLPAAAMQRDVKRVRR